ncbi:MAG: efflux RND transporter permease subunit [Bacteroidota bacterium]|nr:efflux RND transporter permease subunit [Bacteroidota bacterium]
MSIIDVSIKRPLLIIVIFTVLTLLGFVSYSLLNVNLTPKMDIPVLSIVTTYPGAAATEVENSVTKKIEDALSSLENLKTIRSISQEGVSIVTIELNSDANSDIASQDAQRKINAILYTLPSDVKSPSINKFSMDDMPIMRIGATSNMPSTKFYKFVEDKVQARLSKLAGVGQISLMGGNKREIEVNVIQDKLKAYNVSIMQVLNAVRTSNQDFPTGKIENIQNTYSIRLAAKYGSLDQLANTVISIAPDGGKIRLCDVANIQDGMAEQDQITRANMQNSIGIQIMKQTDANTIVVSDLVKKELASIEKEYANDKIKFEISADSSIYTKASVNAVVFDLILAIIIVSLVCFAFLHSLRNAIIIMIAVPLSIIPAFIVLYVKGYSLNIMSLMALSLVVGILVDDSIVVIENMYRYMEMGRTKVQAALEGCKQIMFTAVAITMVIVVVFLPLAIASGLIGNMLREFAMPIIVATLTSLLVSFTFTPMLVSRFGKLQDINKATIGMRLSRQFESIFNSLKTAYGRILEKGFHHKRIILAVTIVLLFGTISLLPSGFIGVAFMPNTDQGEFVVTLEMAPQTTVHQNNLTTQKVEQMLTKHPEIVKTFTTIGASTSMIPTAGTGRNNVSQINVIMVDKKDREISVEDFSQQVKAEISEIPGLKVTVSPTTLTGNASSAPIQIVVKGADLKSVQNAAAMVKDLVKNTPGTSDVKYSIDDPKPEVQVHLNRDKMDELGLNVAEVGLTMRTALAGNTDCKYTDGDYDYDINVELNDFNKSNIDDISRLTFVNNRGEGIELKQFADVTQALGPSMLERYNRITSITVTSNVVGRPSGTVGNEIKDKLANKVPQGISITYSGMMQQQSDAFGSLGFALLAAILLVYLIMVALYDSLLYPFVVLFSIPMAIVGALLALALTMNSLNIFTIIGLITLIGLVAKNAILLVDFANHMKAEGMGVEAALIEAGRERLRPILMTTLAMVFGMLPIAIASGAGAEIKNGMGWVIIGGLISSLLLTLIVVPIVYLIAEKIKVRFARMRKKEVVAVPVKSV